MHWVDACKISPYGRATRLSYDSKFPQEKCLFTRTLDGGAKIYRYRLGFWQDTTRNDLLEGHYDWEPEGLENGLDKAKAILYNKNKNERAEKYE